MRPNSTICLTQQEEYCQICVTLIGDQNVFVQYYDINSEQDLKKNVVNDELKCIRLKVEHNGEDK